MASANSPQDGQLGAACDVGTQAGRQALVQEGAHGRDARGQVDIGLGTVRDKHAVLLHPCPLCLIRPDAVGHNGRTAVAAEQAKPVIGIAVAGRIRAQFGDPGDFALVFRQV